MRVLDRNPSVGDHGPKQSFGDLVGQLIALCLRKVTVQCMHHNVDNTAAHLILGKRIRKFRIHDGKLRAVQICTEPSLYLNLRIGEDS